MPIRLLKARHALTAFILLTAFSIILFAASPAVNAQFAGQACRVHTGRLGRNSTGGFNCGLGLSTGCPRNIFDAYGAIICYKSNRAWPVARAQVGLVDNVTVNIPAPVTKAVLASYSLDDALVVKINGQEVFRKGRFKTATTCGNLDPPISSKKARYPSNIPLPLNAFRQGENTIEVYGCWGRGTNYPDVWSRVCWEYGPDGPSPGAACLEPLECTPTTCMAQGEQCGTMANGCGGTLDCGTCPAGESCQNNQCVTGCTPESDADFCARLGRQCGNISDADNCGVMRTVDCTAAMGECPQGNVCENGACICPAIPQGLACAGKQCGFAPDGCGGTYECGPANGTCPADQICRDGGCITPTISCNEPPCGPSFECSGSNLTARAEVGGNCLENTIICPEGCITNPDPHCSCSPATQCQDAVTLITRAQEPDRNCTITEQVCAFGCQDDTCNDGVCSEGTRCEGADLVTTTDGPDGCVEARVTCGAGCQDGACTPCPDSHCEGADLVEVEIDTCAETRTACQNGCNDEMGEPACIGCTPNQECDDAHENLIITEANCDTLQEACPGGCETLPGNDQCATCTANALCEGNFLVRTGDDCSRTTTFCTNGCENGACRGPPGDGRECTRDSRCVGSVRYVIASDCSVVTFQCLDACMDGACADACTPHSTCDNEDEVRTFTDCSTERTACLNGCNTQTGTCRSGNCFDCSGTFGCTRTKCHDLGTCFFVEGGLGGLFGNKCNPCGLAVNCKDYDGDQLTCEQDRCGLNRCNFCGNQGCIDDFDKDCVADEQDNCWSVQNINQEDSDGDCPLAPFSFDPECGDACDIPCPIDPQTGECITLDLGGQHDGEIVLLANQSLVRNEIPVYLRIAGQPEETIDLVVYTID